MTLNDRVIELTERVKRLKEIQADVDEVGRLRTRLMEAREFAIPISRARSLSDLFRAEGMSVSRNFQEVEKAAANLEVVRTRFAEQCRSASITQGRDWSMVKKYSLVVLDLVTGDLANSWRKFVVEAFNGESPEALSRTLAQTEENRAALSRYRVAHRELTASGQRLPSTREEFGRVRALASQLREIHAEFNFDVPQAVNDFLRAVGGGGANLNLLTAEVFDWLVRNGVVGQYHIVTKRVW